MAKTNYTKVEEALAEGLRKMEVGRLLDIADEVSAAKKEPGKGDKPALHPEQKLLFAALQRDLKYLHKLEKDPFEKGKFDKKEIVKLLKDPTSITEADWQKLKEFKEHVTNFKAEIEKQGVQKTDEERVEDQRRKQITKRFNINDKWLPLR